VARRSPDFRFAYSRPGFVTFKVPADRSLKPDFDLEAVFARAYALSLGKVAADDLEQLAAGVWRLWGNRPARRIHVWQRDAETPGEHDFEPSITPAAVEAAQAIRRTCPRPEMLADGADDPRVPARRGEMILDCVMVEPNQWWVGFHQAHSVASRWPGGMMPLELPPEAVSRAWLKLEEGLRWSQLPIPAADAVGGADSRPVRCAEIGSAPGGATQALLARGYEVLGVDPAEMDPVVLANPRFTHIQRRSVQVRRREFRKVRWLMADMNVAPGYTLDAVEAIVTHPQINVRGLLLTLKLFEWKLADDLPVWIDRIRSWGFNEVHARQLQHNRQEVCVAALQKPFVRK
jgi:23S rRNA (cytidine2498-2'-O)-methyltransferase